MHQIENAFQNDAVRANDGGSRYLGNHGDQARRIVSACRQASA
jgi:hypothetical protein